MNSTLLALFLALPGALWAQSPSPEDRVFTLPNPKECGVVTRLAGNQLSKISEGCLQNVSNFYFDEDWSMSRRGGLSAFNLVACTGSNTIRGLWPFNATDGTNYLVAYSSNSMYQTSGNGTCSVLTPYSGVGWALSASAEMECVQTQGQLYCTNGSDTPFYTNITSSAPLSGAPVAKHIGVFRNRIVMANASANMGLVYMSGELNPTDFTLPAVIFSTSPVQLSVNGTNTGSSYGVAANDGNKINCLMGEFQNQFLVGTDYNTYAISGYDVRDFTVRRISNQVGCIEPKSVQEVNNQLLWVSKRGIEAYTGTQITPVSYYIRPTIAQIIAASGNSRSRTLTSQADWQTGDLCASGGNSCVSATLSPGDVVPSSNTAVDFSTGDFKNTTATALRIDTSAVAVVLSSVTTNQEDFRTSTFTGTPNYWTITGGAFSQDTSSGIFGTAAGNLINVIQSTVVGNSLQYNFVWSYIANPVNICSFPGSSGCISYQFINNNGNYYSFNIDDISCSNCLTKTVTVKKKLGGSVSTLGTTTLNLPSGIAVPFRISFSSFGTIQVSSPPFQTLIFNLFDGDISVSTYTSFYLTNDTANGGKPKNYIATFTAVQYGSGTFTSRVLDTSFSTPIASQFSSVFVTPASTTLLFQMHQSSSPNNDLWDGYVSISSGNLASISGKRYIQYLATMTTTNGIRTPFLSNISILTETTGYYVTPCVQVSSPVSYGTLAVDGVNNGGAFTFQTATGATCGGAITSTANWTAQSPNANIAVTTSTQYIAERVLFSMSSSTNVPTLNDIIFNWNTGSNRPPTASLQYKDRYYLFYTTATVGSPKNDHAAVYDFNGKWTFLDDINAYSAATYLNAPYVGDSAATGTIYQLESGQSDNGGNFTASFQTADLDFGESALIKRFKRLYLLVSAAPNQSQNISWACNYALDGSTASYSLGSYNLSSVPEVSGYGVAKFNFPVGQQAQGHWINVSCSYNGQEGPVSIYGLKLVWRPLNWD